MDNFKSIVKDSLREAFYIPKKDKTLLNEVLLGKRLYVIIDDEINRQLGGPLKIHAVISKNTKSINDYEEDYRISWFDRTKTEAKGHIDFGKEVLDYVLKNEKLPDRLKRIFAEKFRVNPISINIKFVEKFDETKDIDEIIKESKEDFYIGQVDSNGGVKGFKQDKITHPSDVHKDFGMNSFNGGRWRYNPTNNKVQWSDTPTKEQIFKVDDFLFKKGITPIQHVSWMNGLIHKFNESVLLNEGIDGHKFWIVVGKDGEFQQRFPALLSKNTIDGELPYRISWFNTEKTQSMGHIPLTQIQATHLLKYQNGFTSLLKMLEVPLGSPLKLTFDDYYRKTSLKESIIPPNTPEFKQWFHNSKVVDDDGNPMVMYHVSGHEFKEFNPLSHFGTKGQSKSLFYGKLGKGIKMNRTYPVYLSIKNPARMEDTHDNSILSLLEKLVPDLAGKYIKEFRGKSDQLRIETDKKVQLDLQKRIKIWRKNRLGKYPQANTELYNIANLEFLHIRDTVMPQQYKPLLIDALKKKGYDGIIYKNRFETDDINLNFRMTDMPVEEHQKDSYIIFDPKQVWSVFSSVNEELILLESLGELQAWID